jgi:uncharacterized membrane protein
MQFVRTTVIGGLVFLVPIVVLIMVIGKGLEITGKIAAPLAEVLPVDSVGDLAVVHVLTFAILVLICFLAGLAARTMAARRLVAALEEGFLSKLPPYALLKTKTQSMLSPEDIEGMTPVVARFDDSWQIAFEIERVEGGRVAIFLPGAPDPWSGSVCVMTEDRVTPLDLSIPFVAGMAKRLGKGANEALRDHLPASESPAG